MRFFNIDFIPISTFKVVSCCLHSLAFDKSNKENWNLQFVSVISSILYICVFVFLNEVIICCSAFLLRFP